MEDPKNILKKGLEKPSVDFTKTLMQHIKAEEKSLSCVVKEHAEMKTSPSFGKDLMSQLEGVFPKKANEPVISRRLWFRIVAGLAIMISLVFATSEPASRSNRYSMNLDQIDFSFVEKFESNPILTYTIYGALLLSIALLAEQRIKYKKEE